MHHNAIQYNVIKLMQHYLITKFSHELFKTAHSYLDTSPFTLTMYCVQIVICSASNECEVTVISLNI